jgi:hypothetical protein
MGGRANPVAQNRNVVSLELFGSYADGAADEMVFRQNVKIRFHARSWQ